METDRSYFMKRAAQERSAAKRAGGAARKAHRQLADRYSELAQSDEEREG